MKANNDSSSRVDEVALAIIQYLKTHPEAKDTIDGVARWWVGEERAVVREALDLLVQKGFCAKIRDHYCCRRPK